MASIKDLKKKIKSTKGTLKITTAMKLVSAAKLNRAQNAIQSARPYAGELEATVKVISALVQNYSHPLLEDDSENNKTALLVISSSKGLCGGYNYSLIKMVRQYLAETDEDVKCYFIGSKAHEVLSSEVNVGKVFSFEKQEPSYAEVETIGQELRELFQSGEYGRVEVAYNIFHSAISFTTSKKQLLPMTLSDEDKKSVQEEFPFDFKYEPGREDLLSMLIPQTFMTSLWESILNSVAAEHGSRMSAMDSAANNCKDAIRALTLKMNKMRQASITTELIEVVSGAESLNA